MENQKETAMEGFVRFINWVCNPWRSQSHVNRAKKLQQQLQHISDCEEFDSVEECFEETPPAQSNRTKAIATENAYVPVKLLRTRRVRKPKRNKFIKYLVNEARAEFGLPKPTEANRLMVQGFLLRTCKEWGLVSSHTASNVAIALPLVFVPSDDDILGQAICGTYNTRRAVMNHTTNQTEGWFNNPFALGARQGLVFRSK